MNKLLKAALIGTALLPASAQAAVNGVTTIVINNAIGTWLQVAEVQAIGIGGVNFAAASNGGVARPPTSIAPVAV